MRLLRCYQSTAEARPFLSLQKEEGENRFAGEFIPVPCKVRLQSRAGLRRQVFFQAWLAVIGEPDQPGCRLRWYLQDHCISTAAFAVERGPPERDGGVVFSQSAITDPAS